jgi:hypothetical protein
MLVMSYHLENCHSTAHVYKETHARLPPQELISKKKIILKFMLYFGHCTLQYHVNFSITGDKNCSSYPSQVQKDQSVTGLSMEGINDQIICFSITDYAQNM